MAVLGRRTDMDILVTDVNLRGDKRAPRDFRFGPPSGPVQPEFDSLRLTLSRHQHRNRNAPRLQPRRDRSGNVTLRDLVAVRNVNLIRG
jgi:hypothetical protein